MEDTGRMYENTAAWIAAVREKESQRADSLFKDEWAAKLVDKAGEDFMKRSKEKNGNDNQFIVVRTKYFDDFISSAADQCPQIVLLGAGYDVRALRLGLSGGNTVFEIDTPRLLAEKEQKLKGSDLNKGANRVAVPADLESDWRSNLLAHGFEPAIATTWVAEGLFFYLSEQCVRSIMQTIDALSGENSKIIYDVSGNELLTLPSMSGHIDYLQRHGLPLPYCTDYPEDLLNGIGWRELMVDYAGSKTASFGRLKAFEQDLQKRPRAPLNSYFVSGRK
jgi:methyltransferase (TIGR00027 family)